MTQEEANAALQALGGVSMQIYPAWPLVRSALKIATRTGRTVYDSLYLALAVREGVPLVTGDERLVNALRGGPLSPFLLWVADV